MNKPRKSRESFHQSLSSAFNYGSAIIILIFGMVALSSSMGMINEHKRLITHYEFQTGKSLDENVRTTHDEWLYWSVIAVAFCAFVLIVLNNEKVRQLKIINAEKKLTLKLLEDRLAAMETTYDGIGIVGPEGNLTYMNKALRELHEISLEDMDKFIGNPWYDLYNEKGKENVRNKVMPVLEQQGYWRGESPVVRQSGKVAIAELSLTRLRDGGFIGTARDITEKKQTEKEKEELQSQFYQAQKMEAVGRLAGGIAHDFNNILAAMNGYAEFLIDDLDESSPQHKFACNILQAGMQARDLVDQILAFSRREEGNAENLDLTVALHESVAMLSASLPKTIALETHIETDFAPIRGNATQISQIIMNLCVNAKDAMDDDHGVLSIRIKPVEPKDYAAFDIVRDSLPELNHTPPVRLEDLAPDRTRLVLGSMARDYKYVALSVHDTGSGMSRVIMEHIFEPFFTTKPVDKGTGLGLSTVHGVVTGHRGAMIVDSTIGKGTTFEILFPMTEDFEETEAKNIEKFAAGEGGNILVVEDQPEVSGMMYNMLTRQGFDVTCCATGLEALESIRESLEDYDVVITDHNMPVMTGLELICQAHEDFPDLPFILVSGYSQQRLQELMEEHPAIKAILRKPVSAKALGQKINAVIAAARAETKQARSA